VQYRVHGRGKIFGTFLCVHCAILCTRARKKFGDFFERRWLSERRWKNKHRENLQKNAPCINKAKPKQSLGASIFFVENIQTYDKRTSNFVKNGKIPLVFWRDFTKVNKAFSGGIGRFFDDVSKIFQSLSKTSFFGNWMKFKKSKKDAPTPVWWEFPGMGFFLIFFIVISKKSIRNVIIFT
jgi:hypothetical protein